MEIIFNTTKTMFPESWYDSPSNAKIKTIKSEEDINKLRSYMGKDFDIITDFVYKNYGTHTQQELYYFIMDECETSDISTVKKPNQEFMLSEELLFVINCFDTTVNGMPKM